MERLYTLQEVADLLKVSTRTVLRYIKAGKLKATKIGQWRISENNIKDFLNGYSNLNNVEYVKHNKK